MLNHFLRVLLLFCDYTVLSSLPAVPISYIRKIPYTVYTGINAITYSYTVGNAIYSPEIMHGSVYCIRLLVNKQGVGLKSSHTMRVRTAICLALDSLVSRSCCPTLARIIYNRVLCLKKRIEPKIFLSFCTSS